MDKINSSIGQDPEAKSIIGVLDIYGFESFKINRFEIIDSLKYTENVLKLTILFLASSAALSSYASI